MKIWEEMYGQDADGRRGEMRTFCELENTPDERQEIAEILFENGYFYDDNGLVEIDYEGVGIEVDVSDYSDILKRLEEEDDAK